MLVLLPVKSIKNKANSPVLRPLYALDKIHSCVKCTDLEKRVKYCTLPLIYNSPTDGLGHLSGKKPLLFPQQEDSLCPIQQVLDNL